jgi:ubiquinone/menaquinone biosynthesis C-methylase UbiE
MTDAYIAYTHRFFRRWLPVYDLFALSIAWVYRAAVRLAEPAPGRVVLDLCTGTGEVALRLARRGARVIAIDVTPDMLEQARGKAGNLPVDFRLGDARRLALPDRSVDATTLSFALHDMPRPVRLEVLREALRVSRERVVVVDYDFGRSLPGRLAARLVALFETAYLPRFAEEGVAPLLAELGVVPVAKRRLFPFLFGVWVLEPAPGATAEAR